MNTHRARIARPLRSWATASLVLVAGISLVSCAGAPQAAPEQTTSARAAVAETTAAPQETAAVGDAVAGYAVGEIPPLPLFTVPSLAMLDAALGGFAVDVQDEMPRIPGVTITPAACGDAVVRASAEGSRVLNGDGSGTMQDGSDSIVNNGDGSGVYDIGGVQLVVNGDGSGVYTGDDVAVVNNGDGSGTYTGEGLAVVVNGDGSGTLNDDVAGTTLVNNGDGSGTYTDANWSIVNNGDGSGTFTGDGISIVNDGTGMAIVNGEQVDADPVQPAATVGVFPAMGTIAPIEYCGTTITLQDGVLFDFDKADLRPDASETIATLAKVMTDLGVPAAEVGGHTDAIGDDAYNLDLSDRRAASVVAALQAAGVTGTLDAIGYGESAPVAANEVNGEDNPAGRQLNRRVEIFIPAF